MRARTHILSSGIKARCQAFLIAAFALNYCAVSAFAQDGVYILDTKAGTRSDAFVEGLLSTCTICAKATRLDGQGDPRKLSAAAKQIRNSEKALVITTGAPAMNIVVKELLDTPLLSALTTNEIDAENTYGELYVQRSDGPLVWARAIANIIAGPNNSVGVIGGANAINNGKNEMISGANPELTTKYYAVNSPQELPDQIKLAYQENNFVIFLKDSLVVNRRSMDFIIKTSISKKKQTIVYSRALVDMGIPFALSPKPRSLGERAGEVSTAILTGKPLPNLISFEDFELHVNCAAAAKLSYDFQGQKGASLCGLDSLELKGLGAIDIERH